MNDVYERLSFMAYQKENISIHHTDYKKFSPIKVGADVTARLYTQYALTCEVSNPGRV